MQQLKKYLRTYLPFTRAGIQAAMTYRSNFIAWFLGSIVYCLVMYYIWLAVFNSSGEGMINGFTMRDMTVFLFITAMTNFLTDSDGSYDVGEEVRDGNIAMRLIKPVGFHSTFLFTEIGWKLLIFGMIFAPVVIGVEIYKFNAYGGFAFNIASFALYIFSMTMSYLFSFYMNVCFGFMAFFLKNLWGFNIIKSSILRFLSGGVLPLAFMPGALRQVLEWLPFASLCYTPVMIYMGMYSPAETALRLAVQVAWVIVFYIISKLILSTALRHVSVQGG
ncbi:MAG: ABC-2 family transporter protein [Clostridia bacterium]|nr:ABC-2 family transporter protein [Clostridia bacterium]